MYGIAIHISDGLCLDIPNGNAYNGQVVQQYWCNSTPAQQWDVFSYGSHYFKIRSATWPDYCLNNWSSGGATGDYIKLYNCDSNDALFNVVGPAPSNYEQFQPMNASSTCANMWGGQAVGNVMRLYSCGDTGPNSQFRLYQATSG